MGVTTAAFARPVLRGDCPCRRARPGIRRAESTDPGHCADGAYDRNGAARDAGSDRGGHFSAAGQNVSMRRSRLRVDPGRHEIRVAAEDPSRHVVGSVYTYADVPDFAKAPISLSGVILGLRPARPDGPFRDLCPLEPTARREFASASHVTAFVRVY